MQSQAPTPRRVRTTVDPRILLCVWIALGVLASVPAWAQPVPGPGHGPGPETGGPPPHPPGGARNGRSLDAALEGIDLPDEVRADVDEILDAAHAEHRSLHRELRAAHEAMRAKLEAAEPDEEAILGQADEIGRLRTDLEKSRLRTLLAINRRLTPEQREALTEVLGKRRGRGHRGDGPKHDGLDGPPPLE